ncbi:unnamed protein product, partial [Rotaria socialis]
MQTSIKIWLYAIAFVELLIVSLSAQDASSCTDRPSAPKSGKFQVNTHVHSNKRSISIPEPTVVNSIGDYAL